MKKIITIICVSIFTLSISAQSVDEGNILIGASSDLNATIVIPKGEDVDVDDMILHANVYCGYFLIDNFVAGFNLDYMGVDGESISGYGLFSRYYIDGEIYCHLGFVSGDIFYDVGGAVFILEDGTSIDLALGYAIWINDNTTFEPSFNYSIITEDGETEGSKIDLSLGIGVYF